MPPAGVRLGQEIYTSREAVKRFIEVAMIDGAPQRTVEMLPLHRVVSVADQDAIGGLEHAERLRADLGCARCLTHLRTTVSCVSSPLHNRARTPSSNTSSISTPSNLD